MKKSPVPRWQVILSVVTAILWTICAVCYGRTLDLTDRTDQIAGALCGHYGHLVGEICCPLHPLFQKPERLTGGARRAAAAFFRDRPSSFNMPLDKFPQAVS